MACSLYVHLAREARRAVVLRRGPTRQVLMLTWDLKRDVLTPGQWFKGRVYERRCDLSPSGELFVYFAATWKPPYASWTAISRPPYFTALALWPKGDAWGGGGLMKDDYEVQLNHPPSQMTPAEDLVKPRWRVSRLGAFAGAGEDGPIEERRLRRDGWTLVQEGQQREQDRGGPVWVRIDPPRIHAKPSPKRPALVLRSLLSGVKERDGRWYRVHHELAQEDATAVLPGTDWADWNANGDLLFSRGGELFRLGAAAARRLDVARAQRVADLSDLRFAPRPPPAHYG